MKKQMFWIGMILMGFLASCSTYQKTMPEPNVRVQFEKNDFVLSEQVKAEATTTKILGIDFQRIFTKSSGSISNNSLSINLSSIPVVGTFVVDPTSNYALYELMKNNPGYDVVFYPQFETKMVKPILGIGIIAKETKVVVQARLGKLK